MTHSREARILQIAAVAVAAPRYMGAFASALGIMIVDYYTWFPHLEIWSGAAMALIEGWAIAFVFRRLRGIPGRMLPALLLALMLALPAVAAPYLVSSQLGQPVEQIVSRPVLWLWSLLVAAIAPLVLAAVGYAESQPEEVEVTEELPEMIPIKFNNAGFIYLMQRDDGIYKIGRTNNVHRRLQDLQKEYDQQFTLVQAFVVPDQYEFENVALAMTEQFHFADAEHGELREMTDEQVEQFLAKFAEYCFAAEIPKEHTIRKTEPFVCELCGKDFAKVQGLNAHRRHCEGVPVNGREKA